MNKKEAGIGPPFLKNMCKYVWLWDKRCLKDDNEQKERPGMTNYLKSALRRCFKSNFYWSYSGFDP